MVEKYQNMKVDNTKNLNDKWLNAGLIMGAISVGVGAISLIARCVTPDIPSDYEFLLPAVAYFLGRNITLKAGLKREGQMIDQTISDFEQLQGLDEPKGKAR